MYAEIEAEGEAYAQACKRGKAAADRFLENLEVRHGAQGGEERRQLAQGLLHGFKRLGRPRLKKSITTVTRMREDLPASFQQSNENLRAIRAVVMNRWHAREDDILKSAVSRILAEYEEDRLPRGFWTNISDTLFLGIKTPDQCRVRYIRVLDPEAKKGEWQPQEVLELINAVDHQRTRGVGTFISWHDVSEELTQKRSAWHCRAKWARINANLEKRLGMAVVPMPKIRELLLTGQQE